MSLVSIKPRSDRSGPRPYPNGGRILLVKPPYFSPWTPPLGIAILKTFLQQHGYTVRCYDFNADPELWGMHHKYFSILQTLEDVSVNDGYSKLWWILDAHMLAYANGAGPDECARVLEVVVPLQGIRIESSIIKSLLPLVERFYRRLGEMTDQFDIGSFDVVGTSTYTTSLGPSLFFLKRVRECHPSVKTIMGGGAFADDLALGSDNLDTLIREYDFVDHFVLGEGEMLLLKLLEGELAHKRMISIADLKGTTLQMKDVPVPDFSDVSPESYYHLTIEGARSCPFQCSFCSETIQWGDYRRKPTPDFADQVLELAQRYRNNSFFMGDSLMNPYINSFAEELLKRGAGVLYDGYLRADKPVANRKLVKRWADSGCYRVRLGIESAAARVLDSMDKMTTPQVISDALKALSDAGIRTTTYWITGFPGETEEDFRESCDFIREHHRYIYELEAHAYYYYPYGQIGSRLHQCTSLYPDEVTDIIKFKVWEINDADPPRVERFNRLRRMSELASNLGLPNIYTMAERYEAEERWHKLYPLAAEVYADTRLRRDAPAPMPAPVPAPAAAARLRDPALAYRLTHESPLDDEKLAAAARVLAQYNEMLQVRLEGGRLSAAPEAAEGFGVLTLTPTEEERADLPALIRRTAAEQAARLSPEPPDALRLIHLRNGETSEILLVGHPALLDGRSLVLLCEDLFRAYEQFANGRPLSLVPVRKSYADYLATTGGQPAAAAVTAPAEAPAGLRVVGLGPELTRRLYADSVKLYGLTFAEAVGAALLRALGTVAADLKADLRGTDAALERTVGPLTGVRSQHETAGQVKVLVNLERFVEDPWLGAGRWRARGFVFGETAPAAGYELELAPVYSPTEIEVRLLYREGVGVEELVERLSHSLVEEVRAEVEGCERYAAAREFWYGEFDKEAPASNVDCIADRDAPAAGDAALLPGGVSPDAPSAAGRACGVTPDVALLSAFGVLLSRLNGREDVVIAAVLDAGAPPVPLRLRPSWELSFEEFAARVRELTESARGHAQHGLEVLGRAAEDRHTHVKMPSLDVGYVCGSDPAAAEPSAANVEGRFAALPRPPALMLAAAATGARLVYRAGRFSPAVLDDVVSRLEAILEQAASDPRATLGEIRLDDEVGVANAPFALAQDSFSFGSNP